MSAADWRRIHRNYDDDALAALASAGLLRRAAKDLEAGKVGWHADGGEGAGVIEADGQRVQLAPQGPGGASCDCPAPGVCKHILAATLWLRAAPAVQAPVAVDTAADPAPAPADTPDDAPDDASAAPDVLAEVLALDQASVMKAAGAAAQRKAAGLLADLQDAAFDVQGAVLRIALPGLDLVCRYVAGAGFAGMVSESEPRLRKALHLLALAAVWRAHGRAPAWPALAGDAGAAQSAEAAEAASSLPALGLEELRFLAQARALVHEVCAGGWSHVSDIAAPQLRALATSARVEAFPRLAGLLRGLAGTADLLARRDFGADERQALHLAADAHALIHALEAGAARADTVLLARLRGRTQRSFSEGATLELLPLGAYWWEQRSGARGLSVAFWDPAAARVRLAVLARRDGLDPGFGKTLAWRQHTLWQGVGAAATLAGSALILEQPRLSEDGRLGIAAGTRAGAIPAWSLQDARWRGAGFDSWDALHAALAAGAGLLGERLDLALLRPAACAAPQLDAVRQEIVWALRDRGGDTLVLRLPFETWKAGRLDNLEAWTASGTIIAGVVARLERGHGAALLEPVMLLIERDGKPWPVSLDFDTGPARPNLGGRIARMLRSRAATATPPAPRAPLAHARVLDAVLAQFERKAMSGHLHLNDGAPELQALRNALLALGLDTLAALLARYLAAPDTGAALTMVSAVQTCLDLDTGALRG